MAFDPVQTDGMIETNPAPAAVDQRCAAEGGEIGSAM
jgi:hypothetical protein